MPMKAVSRKRITAGPGVRACINCKHCRQYLREEPVPSESYKALAPVGTGLRQRGALRQPCKGCETEDGGK